MRASLLLALCVASTTFADDYRKAPPELSKMLDAPSPPAVWQSPKGDVLLLGEAKQYPPIVDLAEPFVRLAGVRIDLANNAVHGAGYVTSLGVRRLTDAHQTAVALPSNPRVSGLRWNVPATQVAFLNTTPTGVELWLLDVATAKARKVPGVQLNPVLGTAMAWLDAKTLLVCRVKPDRGAAPKPSRAPPGPMTQQSTGVTKQSSTYEARDLLKTPYDADLFEYLATSQLALVDVASGKVTNIGPPSVFQSVSPSPGGDQVLVQRVQRPYSFARAFNRFPLAIEVWDRKGSRVETLATLPLADQVPVRGVRVGMRNVQWRATSQATLVWAEALDDGDLANKVPNRDKVMTKKVGAPATEVLRTVQRYAGVSFIGGGSQVIVNEYDDDRHWFKGELRDFDDASTPARVLWDLSSDEQYANPGSPVFEQLPSGAWAVMQRDGAIFLSGEGATPAGNRPFLDRLDLATLSKRRIFRSSPDLLEQFSGFASTDATRFLTHRQSPTEPPNYWVRTLGEAAPDTAQGEAVVKSTATQVTTYADPTPLLRQIHKELVTYKRADGVALSFQLYLPPGVNKGTPLPTVVWAYPLDYTDPSKAGQVTGSTKEFTSIHPMSPLTFALMGYAVLDEVAMPVVGPVDTAYDTFIEQLTANAKAAIDTAVAMGVTDRERVGVMGHSHGALMTVTLLGHTDLFRAGIARSGAYNHTMRPFGFQNEHRTLYQAPETYLKLSPVLYAKKVNEPVLLVHGEFDANPGTVPLQSEKLFEALRGVGATTRLVMLPFESHGYAARESLEHLIAEQAAWFDLYVKNAPLRASPDAGITR